MKWVTYPIMIILFKEENNTRKSIKP